MTHGNPNHLPDDKHLRLKKLAESQGLSINKLIEELLAIALVEFDTKISKHFADQSQIDKRLRGILMKSIILAKSTIFTYPSKGSLHYPTLF